MSHSVLIEVNIHRNDVQILLNNHEIRGKNVSNKATIHAQSELKFHNNTFRKFTFFLSKKDDGQPVDWADFIEIQNQQHLIKDNMLTLHGGVETINYPMKVKSESFWINVIEASSAANDDFDGGDLTKSAEIEVTPP